MIKNSFKNSSSNIGLTLILASIIPLVIYLYSNTLMIKSCFSLQEDSNIKAHIDHADKVFQNNFEELLVVARDYSVWDDTYEAASEERFDSEWVKDNFSRWIPDNFSLDLLLLASKDRRILDSYGLKAGEIDELLTMAEVRDVLKGIYDPLKTGSSFPLGVGLVGSRPYILAAAPILRSDFSGPSSGVLILGREVSPGMLQGMKDKFGYDISLGIGDSFISPPETLRALGSALPSLIMDDREIIKVDDVHIMAKKTLKDISGTPNITLYILKARNPFFNTLDLLRINGRLVLIFSFAQVFLLVYFLRNIIAPILSLEKQLGAMDSSTSLKYISVEGGPEVKSLETSFNSLVSSLSLKESENKKLKQENNTDELTSLYNHRYFCQFLARRLKSSPAPISIFFIDIDRFKLINDTHGHAAGDSVLKIIGGIIGECIPDSCQAFRYGGEEFILIDECCNLNHTHILAESIRSRISSSPELLKICRGHRVTVSIGITVKPQHLNSCDELVKMADRAMYFAKQNGRDQVYTYDKRVEEFFSDTNIRLRERDVLLDSALAFIAAIDAKDHYTGKHSEMVTKYSLLLADRMELPSEKKYLLRIGSLLHDCGKIGIPDSIIKKPDRLSPEEFDIVKNHTTLGQTILEHIIDDKDIISCVRNHHEYWDGTGYPDALAGNNIPLLARIVSLADAFHSMISNRPYRSALSVDEALDEIRKSSGIQFDPFLAEEFIQAVVEPCERASLASEHLKTLSPSREKHL